MKLEKINDNQIRCTLTSSDLTSRQIKLSELAYGSAKAKRLFQDMMEEAHFELGFEIGNSPLMIEAIPTSPESIVLIITKVDDPEELDTRFSRFTQNGTDQQQESRQISGADDILDLFRRVRDVKTRAEETPERSAHTSAAPKKEKPAPEKVVKKDAPVNLIQAFMFESLDDSIRAARGLNGFYEGQNSLYRRPGYPGAFLLVLHQSGTSPEDFNRVVNILSEYGQNVPFTKAEESYLLEHGRALISDEAVQKLSGI